MSAVVRIVRQSLKDIPAEQVYRYMGMRDADADDALKELVESERMRIRTIADCKACYMVLPVSISGEQVDFSLFSVNSKNLARNLYGCKRAAVFAATIGMAVEQQKKAAAVRSPAKALVMDAVGSAATEAFCDELCKSVAGEYPNHKARPRFSPGYGDFPLAMQKTLLDVLDANRKIGVSLTDGLLMIPQKSVTAVMGLGLQGCEKTNMDCELCDFKDCEFRL